MFQAPPQKDRAGSGAPCRVLRTRPGVDGQEPPAQAAKSTALSEPSVYRVYLTAPTNCRAVWVMVPPGMVDTTKSATSGRLIRAIAHPGGHIGLADRARRE